jgi:predicted tellurium resistance membrane protein TerC
MVQQSPRLSLLLPLTAALCALTHTSGFMVGKSPVSARQGYASMPTFRRPTASGFQFHSSSSSVNVMRNAVNSSSDDLSVPSNAASTTTAVSSPVTGLTAYRSEEGGLVPPFSVTLEKADYSYGEALQRTIGWVGAAVIFGAGLWATAGSDVGEEFFAGYLVEQSLSVDNLFVFLLLFEYFKVPLQYQDRVLNWGIYGAFVMRAVMIGLGAAALQSYHAILLVFASILVYGSVKFFIGGGEEDEEEDPDNNSIVKLSRSLFPSVDYYDGDRFFTLSEGVRKATPLFICMIAVEISDVVFAVDSIPAVFGVTEVSLYSRWLLMVDDAEREWLYGG